MAAGSNGGYVRELDVDELPDGLLVIDGRGRITACNAEAGRLLRHNPIELIGRPVAELPGFPHPSELTDVRERLIDFAGERRLAVRARAGSVGTVLVLRDPAEIAADGLPSADLIAIVAHELRSPLTSVRGFTSSLLAKWERFSDDQRRLMLETVAYDADRLSRLITELLDVTRIATGRLDIRAEPVDPVEIVRSQLHRLGAVGHVRERLVLRAIEPLPRAWIDADKFERIVANLVENAVRHGEGTIVVGLERTAEGFALVVDDDGPGVPEQHRDRVFERFWRGSNRSGTGLGLYIVRGLVEAHRGTVAVGSSPSGGARFRVELPIGRPEALEE